MLLAWRVQPSTWILFHCNHQHESFFTVYLTTVQLSIWWWMLNLILIHAEVTGFPKLHIFICWRTFWKDKKASTEQQLLCSTLEVWLLPPPTVTLPNKLLQGITELNCSQPLPCHGYSHNPRQSHTLTEGLVRFYLGAHSISMKERQIV